MKRIWAFRAQAGFAVLAAFAAPRPASADVKSTLLKPFHAVDRLVRGRDQEKAVLVTQNKQDLQVFDDGLGRLAERMADLTLCVRGNAVNGVDASTLEWYLGDSLGAWLASVERDFNPSLKLSLEKREFAERYVAALKKRLEGSEVPKSLETLGLMLEASVDQALHRARTEDVAVGGGARSLKLLNPPTRRQLSEVVASNHNATLASLQPNCSDRRKGSAFYETPSFGHRAPASVETAASATVPYTPPRLNPSMPATSGAAPSRPTAPPPSTSSTASHAAPAPRPSATPTEDLRRRRGLTNIFSRSLNADTQSLINIAYEESKKNRPYFTETGSRSREVGRGQKRNKQGVIVDPATKDASRSLGACAMYVSIALERQGCVSSGYRAPKASAKLMGDNLPAQGFTNIFRNGRLPEGMKSLHDLPPGAVIVYDGGRHGHVEIKTQNGYVSDYFSTSARTGSDGRIEGPSRKVIGIWVKPACGAGEMT